MILWLILTLIGTIIMMKVLDASFVSPDFSEVIASIIVGGFCSIILMLIWSLGYPYQIDESVTESYQLYPVYSVVDGKSLGYATYTNEGILVHYIGADTKDCIRTLPSSTNFTEIRTKYKEPILEIYENKFIEKTFIAQQLWASLHNTDPRYVLYIPEEKISITDYVVKE